MLTLSRLLVYVDLASITVLCFPCRSDISDIKEFLWPPLQPSSEPDSVYKTRFTLQNTFDLLVYNHLEPVILGLGALQNTFDLLGYKHLEPVIPTWSGGVFLVGVC